MVKKKKLYWFYLLFWKACRSKNSPNQNISSFNYVDLNATSDLQLLQSVTRGHPFHNIINHCHQDWLWWRKVWMAARKCCEALRSATAVFPYSNPQHYFWHESDISRCLSPTEMYSGWPQWCQVMLGWVNYENYGWMGTKSILIVST